MKTIITKVENNRIVKFIETDDADNKLAELLVNYPQAFIYDGAYRPDLYVDGNTVTIQPEVYIPTLLDYDIAIEKHLDAEAEAAGYYDPLGRIPNIDRACSYAGFTNEYQSEGQSFVQWRGDVWAYVYQVKLDVESQVRTQPSISELLQELPIKS